MKSSIPMTAIYSGVADLYQLSRPEYPIQAATLVADRVDSQLGDKYWVDVGSGTGKFTRPLAHFIGDKCRIFGVEPNEDMIAEANKADNKEITYLKSPAETLPFARNSAAVVSAAASAQLFDRPRYYKEVERILASSGVIAFIYNHGRFSESEFLSAYQNLYEANVPGYRRGTFANRHGTFSEVHFAEELAALSTFEQIEEECIEWTHFYDRQSIEARFTSTIHFQHAFKNRARDELIRELHTLIDKYIGSDGRLEFPFTTFVVSATKV
ncbi:class I SAM-dependent methyltransferase [Bradyrhizobium xenonodulans]|uniref:Class I SAM-dependent methyltransferase n=1 Tax=Bradyrhizobium xenonodulans TaxID=2736875 RepID=A0ABY7MLN7_9BRAD|nr:methyltransferase domain-containing protein [Bradyrhizobium xenonodulans]WBL77830.1 class I SAM-dependent methyltransferase [Bradyrhizobium xenonodulans]